MSFDLAVYRLCDHRLLDQELVAQSDLQTLPVPFPLGSNTVELSFNLDRVSPMKWELQPRRTFFVDEDVTPSFDGMRVQVTYPPIKRGIGAKRLIVKVDDVEVTPNDVDYNRGEIALPFNTPGDATIKVTYEQEDFSNNRYRNIVFQNPLPGNRFLFQANYTTVKEFCLKCLGRGYLFDWQLSPEGTIPTLENEDKLIQDIVRHVITDLASDPYRTWMGSRLRGLIGKRIPNVNRIRDIITKEIRETCDKLISLQRQQVRYQTVTVGEALQRILQVDTQLSPQDPTLWIVSVRASTQAGTEVTFVTRFNQLFTDYAVGRNG